MLTAMAGTVGARKNALLLLLLALFTSSQCLIAFGADYGSLVAAALITGLAARRVLLLSPRPLRRPLVET